METVTATSIQEYPLQAKGKVRDIYAIDDETLLIVTTDRMSAFDIVLPDPIPFKGVVLNQLTIFWMNRFRSHAANHLKSSQLKDFPKDLQKYGPELEGRAVLVRRTEPLPIECIVRGYLSGSGFKDYMQNGQVCGYELPEGLRESDKLPRPLFTPSTKAEIGGHDENITLDQARESVGQGILETVSDISLSLYEQGLKHAESRGIIIADTKFEFGLADGEVMLIDEVLTPDSSRFWPLADYEPGRGQNSFDKQYLRDWLTANWDKTPPAPRLPQEVITNTRDKYLEAYRLLTGEELHIS